MFIIREWNQHVTIKFRCEPRYDGTRNWPEGSGRGASRRIEENWIVSFPYPNPHVRIFESHTYWRIALCDWYSTLRNLSIKFLEYVGVPETPSTDLWSLIKYSVLLSLAVRSAVEVRLRCMSLYHFDVYTRCWDDEASVSRRAPGAWGLSHIG